MDGFEELSLELTDRCPLQCLHCSSTSGPDCNNQLSKERSLLLVEEAASIGTNKISFGGGEPTLADHFIDVLTKASDLGVPTEVFTCGLSLSGGKRNGLPDDVINYCGNLEQVKFIFSIHGATPNVHDLMTQISCSFDYLIESIEKCLKVGIECETNFVPTKVNAHQLQDIVDFNRKHGMKKLSVLRFVPQGRGLRNKHALELSRTEEDQFIESLLNLRQFSEVDIRTGSPFNNIIPGNNIPCRAGSSKLVVQANGNVLPCEVYKHEKRYKWNMSVNTQSLSQILNSPQIIKLRKHLERSNCLDCPIHSSLRLQQKTGDSCDLFSKAAILS